MQNELPLKPKELEPLSISPFKELGAYEALWSKKGMPFKKIAEMRRGPESALSDFVNESEAYDSVRSEKEEIMGWIDFYNGLPRGLSKVA